MKSTRRRSNTQNLLSPDEIKDKLRSILDQMEHEGKTIHCDLHGEQRGFIVMKDPQLGFVPGNVVIVCHAHGHLAQQMFNVDFPTVAQVGQVQSIEQVSFNNPAMEGRA